MALGALGAGGVRHVWAGAWLRRAGVGAYCADSCTACSCCNDVVAVVFIYYDYVRGSLCKASLLMQRVYVQLMVMAVVLRGCW